MIGTRITGHTSDMASADGSVAQPGAQNLRVTISSALSESAVKGNIPSCRIDFFNSI